MTRMVGSCVRLPHTGHSTLHKIGWAFSNWRQFFKYCRMLRQWRAQCQLPKVKWNGNYGDPIINYTKYQFWNSNCFFFRCALWFSCISTSNEARHADHDNPANCSFLILANKTRQNGRRNAKGQPMPMKFFTLSLHLVYTHAPLIISTTYNNICIYISSNQHTKCIYNRQCQDRIHIEKSQ